MLLFICEISLITNRLLCFNTSHVTLYPFLVFVIREFISVSIHLMLLFIARRNDRRTVGYWVSIHLMLLFIANSARLMLPRRQFQYISCYSLSLQNLKKLHTDSCFNTSHVTLYRNFHGEMYFQEICFNTSHVTLYQLVAARMEVLAVSFNTSHVTLYPSFYRLFFF